MVPTVMRGLEQRRELLAAAAYGVTTGLVALVAGVAIAGLAVGAGRKAQATEVALVVMIGVTVISGLAGRVVLDRLLGGRRQRQEASGSASIRVGR